MPIQSFGDRRTDDVYNGIRSASVRGLPPDVLEHAPRKLDLLNAAKDLDDLKAPPGNRLEALRGRKGFHRIRINSQWRLIFRWTPSGPSDVQIIDYH